MSTIQQLDSVNSKNIPEWVFTSTEPVLLKGLVNEWPLVVLAKESTTGLVEELKSAYCGEPAPIYFGEDSTLRRLSYNEDMSGLNFTIQKSDVAELLNELLAGSEDQKKQLPVRYIASNVVDYYFPSIRAKNDLSFSSSHFDSNPLEGGDPLVGIWIGNQTISPCHYDAQNNIACCVAGRRNFTLFPPSQIENLYPGPLDLNPGGQAITMVDFDKPDFAKYPKFKEALAHKIEVMLSPGDALFIPVMWWHQVASLDAFNVLINYWWNSFPKVQGQAMAALEHALLSIRHRPLEEKAAWKAIFNYYVFDDLDTSTDHLPSHVHGPLGKHDDDSSRQLRSRILNKLNR